MRINSLIEASEKDELKVIFLIVERWYIEGSLELVIIE